MPKFKWFSVISESIQNIPFLPPNGFPSPSSPFSSSFGVSSELPLLLLNSPSHQLLLLLPLQRCVDALFPYLHGHPFHLDPYYFMPGLLQVSIWWTTAKLIFMQSHVNWICIAFWPGVWTIIWSRLTLFQIIGWPNFSPRGGLTPFMQLKGAQRAPSQLKMKAEVPATTPEEPRVCHLIWNWWPIPCFNSRAIPTSPHTTRGGLCH